MPRTATKTLWPFQHADTVFASIAARVEPQADFDPAQSTFVLDPDDYGQGPLKIELDLDFDRDRLVKNVGINDGDIRVVLVVDAPLARLRTERERWELARVPRMATVTVDVADQPIGDLNLQVVAILDRQKNRGSATAWRRTSVLAERPFRIHLPRTASLFSVEYTSFQAQEWDPKALWYVRFRDLAAAHEASPGDVVEVHLNKDLPGLHFLWTPGATRRGAPTRAAVHMLRKTIFAEILSQIANPTLASLHRLREKDADLEPSPESLTSAVFGALDGLGLPQEAILKLVSDDPGELHRRIQAMVGAGSAFDEGARQDLLSAGVSE